MAKNLFRLEFAGNPDLRDYFSRTQAGDECELTVTFAISAVGEETVEGSLKRVELPESAESKAEQVEPDGEEPASILIRSNRNSGKTSSRAQPIQETA